MDAYEAIAVRRQLAGIGLEAAMLRVCHDGC